MLYVLYGESFWARSKLTELWARAREKNYDILKLEEDGEPPLNSFLSRDLFGQKVFLVLEGLLENFQRALELKNLAPDLVGGENFLKRRAPKCRNSKNPPRPSSFLGWKERPKKSV